MGECVSREEEKEEGREGGRDGGKEGRGEERKGALLVYERMSLFAPQPLSFFCMPPAV